MTLLTPKQVAEYLQLSEVHVARLLRSNDIPHFKIGKLYRIEQEELDAWVMNRMRRKKAVGSLYRKDTTATTPVGESTD